MSGERTLPGFFGKMKYETKSDQSAMMKNASAGHDD
jgi:hypothetical protein